MDALIAQLAPHKEEILSLSERLSAKVMVTIDLDLGGTNGPGMCLNHEALRFLADIGASCDIDIWAN